MADVAMSLSTRQWLAQRMRDERDILAAKWLAQLQESLALITADGFASDRLLEPLPELIAAIASAVDSPDGASLDINPSALARAAELGELRQVQHASIQQVLREYRLLAEVLEEFVAAEVALLEPPEPTATITALRQLNDAVRLLQQHTVDRFVANYTQTIERQTSQLRLFSQLVSHQIRQPLAVLQVLSQALPVNDSDPAAARMSAIFERSVRRLADVTGKLERLARIAQAPNLSPNERLLDLSEVAHTAAAQLTRLAAAHDVRVQVHPKLPVVPLDPARAELIFGNLIANAIRFADPRKPTRYVDISPGGDEQPSVIIRDNGIGMPPGRLQTIFREFVRAHAQRDDEVRAWGLGLGLSIVREAMDHTNGWVRVDSIEGRGTTFKLTWPLRDGVTAR
jgi:signal transduction histidine kinase